MTKFQLLLKTFVVGAFYAGIFALVLCAVAALFGLAFNFVISAWGLAALNFWQSLCLVLLIGFIRASSLFRSRDGE